MCRTCSAAAITVMLALAPLRAQEAPDIRIDVTPSVSQEGETVRVSVWVEPNAANRSLRIEADSPRLFRSSEFQLNGDNAASVHTLTLKAVPFGTYEVRATLLRQTGEPETVISQFRVIGGSFSPGG